ncbi:MULTISPECIES: hypothetical protein [Planktothrix]|uniref:Uncharacterized protein n=1 Tax=Planktothrix rubescens CCAP 1459/22 TaxID=329571 RepID=A0A6J7ZHX5_PLARU|nr:MULTISPECIES: hypothetical protein [Planktothrix]MCF3577531.1 hypothetical protein [Planktothrix agardhii 1812]MCF3647370.1 hypothetical protein [Planktothrix agardhii 1026]CAC5340591.1 hypothetical protein PLAN_100641 [Planktothrix rubescens NIVA-CYA 18]
MDSLPEFTLKKVCPCESGSKSRNKYRQVVAVLYERGCQTPSWAKV